MRTRNRGDCVLPDFSVIASRPISGLNAFVPYPAKRFLYIIPKREPSPQGLDRMTADINARLSAHNGGMNQSTAQWAPWHVDVLVEPFLSDISSDVAPEMPATARKPTQGELASSRYATARGSPVSQVFSGLSAEEAGAPNFGQAGESLTGQGDESGQVRQPDGVI
jgi:hypothetical protein